MIKRTTHKTFFVDKVSLQSNNLIADIHVSELYLIKLSWFSRLYLLCNTQYLICSEKSNDTCVMFWAGSAFLYWASEITQDWEGSCWSVVSFFCRILCTVVCLLVVLSPWHCQFVWLIILFVNFGSVASLFKSSMLLSMSIIQDFQFVTLYGLYELTWVQT